MFLHVYLPLFLEGWSYLGTYLLASEIIYAMLVAVWWSFSDPAFPPFAWFSQAGTLNTINYFKLFSIKRFSVLLLIQKNMSRPEQTLIRYFSLCIHVQHHPTTSDTGTCTACWIHLENLIHEFGRFIHFFFQQYTNMLLDSYKHSFNLIGILS